MPIVDDKEGKLCEYRDYVKLEAENARLQAEVERLRNLGIKLESMIDPLKAEVERLRKAGDAMLLAINKRDDIFDNSDKDNAIADWNAAKEGKPSI